MPLWSRRKPDEGPVTFMGQPVGEAEAPTASGLDPAEPAVAAPPHDHHPARAAGHAVGIVVSGLAAAAMAAGITLTYEGVRRIMNLVNGSCGGRGVSSITVHCTTGDGRMLTVGILATIGGMFLLMMFTSSIGGPSWAAFCAMFAGLFGALGASFYSYGQHNVLNTLFPGKVDNSGWKYGAYAFWAVAGGAALMGLYLIGSYLLDSFRPDSGPRFTTQPVVAAHVPGRVAAVPAAGSTAARPSPAGPASSGSPAPGNPLVPTRIVVPGAQPRPPTQPPQES